MNSSRRSHGFSRTSSCAMPFSPRTSRTLREKGQSGNWNSCHMAAAALARRAASSPPALRRKLALRIGRVGNVGRGALDVPARRRSSAAHHRRQRSDQRLLHRLHRRPGRGDLRLQLALAIRSRPISSRTVRLLVGRRRRTALRPPLRSRRPACPSAPWSAAASSRSACRPSPGRLSSGGICGGAGRSARPSPGRRAGQSGARQSDRHA